MDSIRQVTENKKVSLDSVAFNPDGRIELCHINYDTDERSYAMRLETDLTCVSLEGMNQFRIYVSSQHKSTD